MVGRVAGFAVVAVFAATLVVTEKTLDVPEEPEFGLLFDAKLEEPEV